MTSSGDLDCRFGMSMLLSPIRPANQLKGEWLVSLISEINKLLKARNFLLVDLVLKHIDPAAIEPATALAFLRTTYPVRDRLPHWSALRTRTNDAFIQGNLAAAELLRGLP